MKSALLRRCRNILTLMSSQFASDDGTLEADPDHVMRRWSTVFKSAGVKMGKTFDVEAEKWIPDAGFVDVQSRSYKIPVGMWPKNKVCLSFTQSSLI